MGLGVGISSQLPNSAGLCIPEEEGGTGIWGGGETEAWREEGREGHGWPRLAEQEERQQLDGGGSRSGGVWRRSPPPPSSLWGATREGDKRWPRWGCNGPTWTPPGKAAGISLARILCWFTISGLGSLLQVLFWNPKLGRHGLTTSQAQVWHDLQLLRWYDSNPGFAR